MSPQGLTHTRQELGTPVEIDLKIKTILPFGLRWVKQRFNEE